MSPNTRKVNNLSKNIINYINSNNSSFINKLPNNDTSITAKNVELLLKESRQNEQLLTINEKEKLLYTRSRMLQIAQERNVYKKKIIYTLIFVILSILILTCVLYVMKKKGSSAPKPSMNRNIKI
jgi:hypothetical protein